MEQPTSDRSSSADLVYTLRQFHRIGCDRKLPGERQTDRQRQWQSEFRVIGIAVAVTGHLRPSFYILQFRQVFLTFRMFNFSFLLVLLVLLLLPFTFKKKKKKKKKKFLFVLFCCCLFVCFVFCLFFFFFTIKKLLRTVAYTNLSDSLITLYAGCMLIHV